MARFEYLDPIKAIHGKLAKSHRTVYHAKSAYNNEGVKVNYSSIYEKPSSFTWNANQLAAQARFAAIAALVRARKTNSTTLPADKAAFAAQSSCKSFNGYLWKVCGQQYDAQ